MPEHRELSALLIDFGGVLTSDIWSSFAAFCEQRGLDPEAAKQLFREDPDALAELRRLGTGGGGTGEVERRLAALPRTQPGGPVDGPVAGPAPGEPEGEAGGGGRRSRQPPRA